MDLERGVVIESLFEPLQSTSGAGSVVVQCFGHIEGGLFSSGDLTEGKDR